MKMNKKGVEIGFATENLGTMIFVLAIVLVILFILIVWFGPSLSGFLKKFSLW